MGRKVTEILNGIEALPEEEREQLLVQLSQKYTKFFTVGENDDYTQKEEKQLIHNVDLKEANRKVDQILPDLWAKAERNLKEAEAEYKREKGEK